MSRTTLYLAPQSGPVRAVTQFWNSWGFFMRIWNAVSEALFRHPYPLRCAYRKEQQAVWNLWMEPRLPRSHRLVLLSTFDYAVIEYARLVEMAEAYEDFAHTYPVEGVDHLCRMALLFRELAAQSIPDAAGICFQGTSVAETLWWTQEGWDDLGHEIGRPYDLAKDKDHWFVFEKMEMWEAAS